MAFFLVFGRNPIFFLFIKKGNKQIINNHRPVSLLPICGEFFEKLQFFIIYFLMIIIFSVLISQDTQHQIPANINFFQ